MSRCGRPSRHRALVGTAARAACRAGASCLERVEGLVGEGIVEVGRDGGCAPVVAERAPASVVDRRQPSGGHADPRDDDVLTATPPDATEARMLINLVMPYDRYLAELEALAGVPRDGSEMSVAERLARCGTLDGTWIDPRDAVRLSIGAELRRGLVRPRRSMAHLPPRRHRDLTAPRPQPRQHPPPSRPHAPPRVGPPAPPPAVTAPLRERRDVMGRRSPPQRGQRAATRSHGGGGYPEQMSGNMVICSGYRIISHPWIWAVHTGASAWA